MDIWVGPGTFFKCEYVEMPFHKFSNIKYCQIKCTSIFLLKIFYFPEIFSSALEPVGSEPAFDSCHQNTPHGWLPHHKFI